MPRKADLAAIQQLLARYCFAHDSRDLEALGATFADDVTLMGLKGRDNVVARYAQNYSHRVHGRRHVLTNFILLEDGEERAVVQSYITLYLIKGEQLETHLVGVYTDTVIMERGEWKILSRDATIDVPYDPGDNTPGVPGTYVQEKH